MQNRMLADGFQAGLFPPTLTCLWLIGIVPSFLAAFPIVPYVRLVDLMLTQV